MDPPPGCRFVARCPYAVDACTEGDQPPLYAVEDAAHEVSCVHFGPSGDPSVVLGDGRGNEAESTGEADD
jgi:peptide/nickel transport system ATP-binding protein